MSEPTDADLARRLELVAEMIVAARRHGRGAFAAVTWTEIARGELQRSLAAQDADLASIVEHLLDCARRIRASAP